MRIIRHSIRQRHVGLVVFGLLLVLTLAGGSPAGAVESPAPWPLTLPPKAPLDPQQCMSHYLDNLNRCQEACCFELLWFIPINCNETCLAACRSAAEQVFNACMGQCPECGQEA